MQIKHPVEVLKKKVAATIVYKIKWNTGSITYEPMIELSPEMLQIVNKYELCELQKKREKVSEKSNLKSSKVVMEQLKQLELKEPEPKRKPHKPRDSQKGVVKSMRKTEGKIEFLIIMKDEGYERWAQLEEVSKRIPVAVCDYLLQKVKFGGK